MLLESFSIHILPPNEYNQFHNGKDSRIVHLFNSVLNRLIMILSVLTVNFKRYHKQHPPGFSCTSNARAFSNRSGISVCLILFYSQTQSKLLAQIKQHFFLTGCQAVQQMLYMSMVLRKGVIHGSFAFIGQI